MHERGYAGASVRDIVRSAGVPQGSFSNNFASKEVFGLEILNIYYESRRKIFGETLLNDALPPLKRLRSYIDEIKGALSKEGLSRGCMFGNFGVEAGRHSELIRIRVAEIFSELQAVLAHCLRAAVQAGELPKDTECDEVACFILEAVQGAILLVKAQRSIKPFEICEHILLSNLLGEPDMR